jgi:hypothetical protein
VRSPSGLPQDNSWSATSQRARSSRRVTCAGRRRSDPLHATAVLGATVDLELPAAVLRHHRSSVRAQAARPCQLGGDSAIAASSGGVVRYLPVTIQPSPWRAARRAASRTEPPTHTGIGRWTGSGLMPAPSMVCQRPWKVAAERREFEIHPPDAYPETQPAAAEHVDLRGLLGQCDCLAERAYRSRARRYMPGPGDFRAAIAALEHVNIDSYRPARASARTPVASCSALRRVVSPGIPRSSAPRATCSA